MWPDIEKVSLFEEVPAEVQRLPRTLDRIEASQFLGGHDPFFVSGGEVDSDWRRKVMSWLTWASLVAFAGIRDSLNADLEDVGLSRDWRTSQQRSDMYGDPLIAVLLELRNYEVHFEIRRVDVKRFQALLGFRAKPNEPPQERDFGEHVFIAEVDFTSLSRLRNIRSGQSPVTASMVHWFNQQTSAWPAAYLLGTARERCSEYIAQFLRQQEKEESS